MKFTYRMSNYPTQRSMGRFRDEELGFEDDTQPHAAMIPWIDIHQHGHLGSWNDRHQIDISNGYAVVMIANHAHFSPYRPMQPTDVRHQWDSVIRRSHAISRSHFFDAYVAIAMHMTRTRVENPETVMSAMEEYVTLPEVLAVGETGIVLNTTQVDDPWTLEEQREVVSRHMAVARAADLPVICHTPSSMKSTGSPYVRGKTEGGHDFPPVTETGFEGGLNPEAAKREATEIDIDIADSVGLAQDRVLIDHATPETAEYVLDHSDCFVGFSIGQTIHDAEFLDVAEIVKTHGPDRIVLDTDFSGVAMNTPFGMKEAILELLRLGIAPETVRQVVYENPRSMLGLDSLPA